MTHGSFLIAGGPVPGAFASVGPRDAMLRSNGAIAMVRTIAPECDVEVDVRVEAADVPVPSGEWTRKGGASIDCPDRRITIARGAGGEHELDAPAATILVRSNGADSDGVERFLISIRPAAMTEAKAREGNLRRMAARRASSRPTPPPRPTPPSRPRAPRGTIWVEYHQFYVVDPSIAMPERGNFHSEVAIVAVAEDLLHVRTGVAMGHLPVAVEVLRDAPETVEEQWEDVAEASVRLPSGRVAVRGFDGGHEFDLDAPGARVRVSAFGRDAQWDLVVDEDTVERYLVQLWPAESAPAVTLRARSQLGRQEVGGQPG